MNNPLGVVVIMAKRPSLGNVKTRLATSVGNEKALELYRRMLEKTFQTVESVHRNVVIMLAGEGELSVPKSFIQAEQIHADLGERMFHGFQTAFNHFPNQPAVMIGTDCFDLTVNELNNAFDSLKKHELVFGPSADGGYYLIGANRLQPVVFDYMEWSVSTVMQETRNRMVENKLSWDEVTTLNDIDTLEDLKSSSLWPEVKTKFEE